MLKTATTKLPAILLILAACFMTVSGPVRVAVLTQEAETEKADQVEAKELCHRKAESRRLRPRHHQTNLFSKLLLEDLRELPLIEVFHQESFSFWQSSPPLLRAPPA